MMLLGCIADDFTGATDLAGMLVRGGMRTMLRIGLPGPGEGLPQADAVVVALKTRTIDPQEAVRQSLQAWEALRKAGARQCFFKICSTFDSTDRGNIGPVTDALMQATGASLAVACPAFPENGRSIFRGHLFVGDVLLSDSSMRDHPLTPMRDANLVRVLQRQTRQKVGLARFDQVGAGPQALAQRLAQLRNEGVAIAIADALSDTDLRVIGEACASLPLLVGGSGLAIGLPENFRREGLLGPAAQAAALPAIGGPSLAISGSCSAATLAQVARWREHAPVLQLDVLALAEGQPVVEQAIAWAKTQLAQGPAMIAAGAHPDAVAAIQAKLGAQHAGSLIESALARIATTLVAQGLRRLVVAGGETSGAVVGALGLQQLRVGPTIDPGVPWMVAQAPDAQTGASAPSTLAIALKSGNFGAPDFFAKAFAMLPSPEAP